MRKIGRKYKDQWESTVKELEDLRKTAAGQQQSSSEHEQNEIRKMEQAHSETREKLVALEQAQKAAEERQAVVERERDEAKAKVTEMEKECDELKMKVAQCEAELNSQKMQLETVQQVYRSCSLAFRLKSISFSLLSLTDVEKVCYISG